MDIPSFVINTCEYVYIPCLKCTVFQRVGLCEMSPLLHTGKKGVCGLKRGPHMAGTRGTSGPTGIGSRVVWGVMEFGERERNVLFNDALNTFFIYCYMASDIWLRTILIVRKETRCRHIGNSFRLAARVLLYAPSHRQDNTYHGLCYTSRGALAGTRNSSMGPPHEGLIRRPIAPWANALPLSYVPLLEFGMYRRIKPKEK